MSRRRCGIIAPLMLRNVVISLLCISVVLLGVPGLHAHMGSAQHATHESPHSGHHHAALVSIFDAAHADFDGQHEQVDLDVQMKAVSKTTSAKLLAVWFAISAMVIVVALRCTVLPHASQTRPPKRRTRSHLLPPPHAPPAAA